jgi:hypothetical protein
VHRLLDLLGDVARQAGGAAMTPWISESGPPASSMASTVASKSFSEISTMFGSPHFASFLYFSPVFYT